MSLGFVEVLKFGSASGTFSPLQPPLRTESEQTNKNVMIRSIHPCVQPCET